MHGITRAHKAVRRFAEHHGDSDIALIDVFRHGRLEGKFNAASLKFRADHLTDGIDRCHKEHLRQKIWRGGKFDARCHRKDCVVAIEGEMHAAVH